MLGDNSISVDIREQIWDLTVDGFPYAIIDAENSFEKIYYTADKLNQIKSSKLNIDYLPGTMNENFIFAKIAIKYVPLISANTCRFTNECRSGKGYFARINNDIIQIVENEIPYIGLSTKDFSFLFVLGFTKILKILSENPMALNNIENSFEALTIPLRINLNINGNEYKVNNDIKCVIDSRLNMQDETIYIGYI